MRSDQVDLRVSTDGAQTAAGAKAHQSAREIRSARKCRKRKCLSCNGFSEQSAPICTKSTTTPEPMPRSPEPVQMQAQFVAHVDWLTYARDDRLHGRRPPAPPLNQCSRLVLHAAQHFRIHGRSAYRLPVPHRCVHSCLSSLARRVELLGQRFDHLSRCLGPWPHRSVHRGHEPQRSRVVLIRHEFARKVNPALVDLRAALTVAPTERRLSWLLAHRRSLGPPITHPIHGQTGMPPLR